MLHYHMEAGATSLTVLPGNSRSRIAHPDAVINLSPMIGTWGIIKGGKWMQRARSFAVLAVLVVVGLVASSWATGTTAAPRSAIQSEDDPAFDLSLLAIYPIDTGDDGYILIDGRGCLTPETCATPIFFGGETQESLTAAGLTRAYALGLAKLSPEGTFPATRSLATTIAEYSDEVGAASGLTTFLAWLSDPTWNVDGAPTIGDESQLFDSPDGLPSDDSTGVVGLRFRIGTLVVGIEIRDYSGEAVDQNTVQSLAEEVAERIEALSESSLGSLALHHRAGSAEYYVFLDGTAIPLSGESVEQTDSRDDEFNGAGIDNVFLSNQALVVGDDPNNPEVVMYITLYQLPSTSAASDYLFRASNAFAAQRERSGGTTDEPEERPAVGDESVWYLNIFSDAYQAMGFVRVGDIVARVIWQKNQPVNLGEETKLLGAAEADLLPGATYSAEQQVICIEKGGCPGLTRLSSRLLP